MRRIGIASFVKGYGDAQNKGDMAQWIALNLQLVRGRLFRILQGIDMAFGCGSLLFAVNKSVVPDKACIG
jgi:hypothetical protein